MSGALPDLHGLTDPGAIAAARAALDVAESRAAAEAAAENLRAAAEAQQAEESAFQAEVDGLAGPWEPVAAARQALAEAQARRREAEATAEAARDALARARDALPALVERAAAGEAIGAKAVAAAHAAVTSAEQFAAFRAVVAGRVAAAVPAAEAALKEAIAAAHQPVLERGIDLRIEAGAAIDAVARITDRHAAQAAAETARAIFDRGNHLIRYAAERGVAVRSTEGGLSLHWPTRERAERFRWQRPAPGGAA